MNWMAIAEAAAPIVDSAVNNLAANAWMKKYKEDIKDLDEYYSAKGQQSSYRNSFGAMAQMYGSPQLAAMATSTIFNGMSPSQRNMLMRSDILNLISRTSGGWTDALMYYKELMPAMLEEKRRKLEEEKKEEEEKKKEELRKKELETLESTKRAMKIGINFDTTSMPSFTTGASFGQPINNEGAFNANIASNAEKTEPLNNSPQVTQQLLVASSNVNTVTGASSTAEPVGKTSNSSWSLPTNLSSGFNISLVKWNPPQKGKLGLKLIPRII